MPIRDITVPTVFLLVCLRAVSITNAAAQTSRPEQTQGEEIRLDNNLFRAELRKRGLTEILAQHLREFPPQTTLESQLAMYDIRRSESRDNGLSTEDRRKALHGANAILEQLLTDFPNDPRHFQWTFDLGHSLLYDEAEPLLTRILYQDGRATHGDEVLPLTQRALQLFTTLSDELDRENDRLDHLSVAEYETLASSDYLTTLDRLEPQTDYVILWALFYDAIPRASSDPQRARRLHEIIARINAQKELLDVPQKVSGVRIQSLLLAGMTYRRLQRFALARDLLQRALQEADGLSDSEEKMRLNWAVTLAKIENVRNDTDDSRFPDALRQALALRHSADEAGNFGMRLVAALLVRSVYQAQRVAAQTQGDQGEADELRTMSWSVLDELARKEPRRRDEIYAALYDSLGPNAQVASLDPLEQCAMIAGLLHDAEDASDGDTLLDRAITVADGFLSHHSNQKDNLVAEVLFNSAVACYRRGRLADAMQRLVRIAGDFPTFPDALRSASLAVQIGSEAMKDTSLQKHPEVQDLYETAISTLVSRYADSDAAHFWKFYYAQFLDEHRKYAEAAAQYAGVDPAHEHYLLSIAARARCLAAVMQSAADTTSIDQLAYRGIRDDFFNVCNRFVSLATQERNRTTSPARRKTLNDLLAQLRVESAEVQILPHVDRFTDAIATLENFESDCPNQTALLGDVWRVRLIAYEKLGQLGSAAKAVPQFVKSDPATAGPTLQAVYQQLVGDSGRFPFTEGEINPSTSVKMALLLAEQIHEWATKFNPALTPENRLAIDLQLAESNLRAGKFERARDLFQTLHEAQPERPPTEPPANPLVEIGYAEALYRLDDRSSALPRFNRLAVTLPPNDTLRWTSLLRDLQCRLELNEPPSGIIKVIEQQQFLYPDMGGDALQPAFQRVLREAQRRADG